MPISPSPMWFFFPPPLVIVEIDAVEHGIVADFFFPLFLWLWWCCENLPRALLLLLWRRCGKTRRAFCYCCCCRLRPRSPSGATTTAPTTRWTGSGTACPENPEWTTRSLRRWSTPDSTAPDACMEVSEWNSSSSCCCHYCLYCCYLDAVAVLVVHVVCFWRYCCCHHHSVFFAIAIAVPVIIFFKWVISQNYAWNKNNNLFNVYCCHLVVH